jgi:hypothetical protein
MSDEPVVECSICGRNGGPYVGCNRGCNGNSRFIQSRAYTLSEERAGRAPKNDRYGDQGQLGPKTKSPLWAGNE